MLAKQINHWLPEIHSALAAGEVLLQIRYKHFCKLEDLSFLRVFPINAEPTVSGGETVGRGSSFIFMLEKQNQRGTETARGPGVIMHPCCILFIYPL